MAGYDWSRGKSNNAVAAEMEGLRVRSKITGEWLRGVGVREPVGFVKWLVRHGFIGPDEWHHSSKFFNRVDYYAAASVRDQLDELVDGGRLEILRGMYADPGVRALDTSSARWEYIERYQHR